MQKKTVALTVSILLIGAGVYMLFRKKTEEIGSQPKPPSPTPSPTPSPAPSPAPAPATLTNITDNVNTYLSKMFTRLRSSPSTSISTNIVYTYPVAGTELKATKQGKSADGFLWFIVSDSSGRNGYVRQDAVDLKATIPSGSGTTGSGGGVTPPIPFATTLKTKSGTRLRSSATTDVSTNIIYTYPTAGQILNVVSEITGNNAGTGGYTWYKVTDTAGRSGFVRLDAITVVS